MCRVSSLLAVLAVASVGPQFTAADGNSVAFTIPKKSNVNSVNTAASVSPQKIIGGKEVAITLYPFMASIALWVASSKSYAPQCGATVLDRYHILAAGHCVKNRNPKAYRIRVGSNNRTSGGQVANVSKITAHPKFKNGANLDYDVSVLRLQKPLRVDGKTVQKVDLAPPSKNRVTADIPIKIVGWGYTDPYHIKALPDLLHAATISTISHEDCESSYSSFSLTVSERMLCGMAVDGSQTDSCQGDSGGPVINSKTGQQIGIISWAMGCAQMGQPAVFANVANPEINAFIKQAMKK